MGWGGLGWVGVGWSGLGWSWVEVGLGWGGMVEGDAWYASRVRLRTVSVAICASGKRCGGERYVDELSVRQRYTDAWSEE